MIWGNSVVEMKTGKQCNGGTGKPVQWR